MMDMVHALLNREKNASVVVIDWRGGSSPPYAKAATNIRLVGAMAAHVVHLIYVRKSNNTYQINCNKIFRCLGGM